MQQSNLQLRTQHQMAPLPFSTDALEPFISRETVEFHYGKHHRGYVTKLNELIEGTEFETMPLAEIVSLSSGPVFNNAAQAWNHDFYWNCLDPSGKSKPSAELSDAIHTRFGSLGSFAHHFKNSAATKFGSGWTWLVRDT